MSDIKNLLDKVIHEAFLLGYNNAKRSGSYFGSGTHIPIQSKKELLAKIDEACKPTPAIDDTFNDDTPVQTFGEIQTLSTKQKRNVNFDAYQLISDGTPAQASIAVDSNAVLGDFIGEVGE